MKFEKITDTKIKIILDTKDIKLHNISSENIFNNSRSSQQLLKTMLIRAEKEIGFKTGDSKLLVEALMSSDEEYTFIITKLIEKKQEPEPEQTSFVFKFNNFDDFISLCSFLNNISDLNLRNFSENFSLISYNNNYYLYDKNTENYSVLLDYMEEVFSEFGTKVPNSSYISGLLNEYGKIIFEDNAIINCIFNFV